METVSNYAQEIQFVTGFAGSGKSTKLANITAKDVLVLTPTHKASDVLRAKGIENVYTIYSVLKLVPFIDQNWRKGDKLQKLTKIGETDLNSITKIAIDEFSMIPTSVLDLLLEVLPKHAKVVIFGDPYQLPPVDGEPIEPLMYTDNILELTTQHRAEAPEVVETFMRFMNYIKNPRGGCDLTLNDAIEHGTLEDFNPETDRALAFTNNKVIEMNNEIASHLGLTEEIELGHEVLANTIVGLRTQEGGQIVFPLSISKGRLKAEEEIVKDTHKAMRDINKFGTDLSMYEKMGIEVNGEDYTIFYDYDHYNRSKELKAEVENIQMELIEYHNLNRDVDLPAWCRMHRNEMYVQQRGQAWSAYIAHQNLVFSVRRPYATTVHKAQGQEFDTVYIAQADMKRSIRKGYYLQYARLMYVALSRARRKVVIV